MEGKFIREMNFRESMDLGIKLNSNLLLKMKKYKRLDKRFDGKEFYSILISNFYHTVTKEDKVVLNNYYYGNNNIGDSIHSMLVLTSKNNNRCDYVETWIRAARKIYVDGIQSIPEEYRDYVVKPEKLTDIILIDYRNIIRTNMAESIEYGETYDPNDNSEAIKILLEYYNKNIDIKQDSTTDLIRNEDNKAFMLSCSILDHAYTSFRRMISYLSHETHEESFYDLACSLNNENKLKVLYKLYEGVMDVTNVENDFGENIRLLFTIVHDNHGKASTTTKVLLESILSFNPKFFKSEEEKKKYEEDLIKEEKLIESQKNEKLQDEKNKK